MCHLVRSLFLLLLFSCHDQVRKENNKNMDKEINKAIKSFSIIEKDTSYPIDYQFNKQSLSNGVSFSYNSAVNSLYFLCDTAKSIYKGVFNKVDTEYLALENQRFYTINKKDFRILKLVKDPDVTDGTTSFFLSTDLGLLISKSNTWRIGKILNPDEEDTDYSLLMPLFFKIVIDEEFLRNKIPESKVRFVTPKVE